MQQELKHLVEEFKNDPTWTVFPADNLPYASTDPRAPMVKIPDEILYYFELCGGMETNIRSDDDLAVRVVSAPDFNWAVEAIIGRIRDDAVDDYQDNIIWHCYILASVGTDEYFVIDLAPARYGCCYFTELYFLGREGWVPVVADSFLELLERLKHAAALQEKDFWESSNLGDAYDR